MTTNNQPSIVDRVDLFSDALCMRALRHLAAVGEMPQRELMRYFRDVVGGKAQITFAFDRFTHGRRHLFDRKRIPPASNPDGSIRMVVDRWSKKVRPVRSSSNLAKWVAPAPPDWIAALDDHELQRAFESLENQMLLQLADADETTRWLGWVRNEINRRIAK